MGTTERREFATARHPFVMNLQVVARFSATTAHNHECRPVIKPLRYPKNEELPENSQDRVGCEIFYPASNIFISSSETLHSNRWQTGY